MKVLITGGAGFIGSNFIRYWLKNYPKDWIVNLDKLTYAGHIESLKGLQSNPNYQFIKGDICDEKIVEKSMKGVDIVVHFAAETHVDRSIIDPTVFVKTNVLGTNVLLDSALKNKVKRFHHISTDEVYGSLGLDDSPFTEETNFAPRSPYAASKSGAEQLVIAYFITYGLPVTVTNCADNFGPFHDPEKLIPRFVTNLLMGKKVPLMGEGENIREWLYVKDHCRAIDFVLNKGTLGEKYLISGTELTNMEVTKKILALLGKDKSWIEFVEHRLGHDFRYAINDSKLRELGWMPQMNFDKGLEQTIEWYKKNGWWWKPLINGRPIVDRVAQKSYG
ncbi:dTDP-glucose 4,6-dehydratase [Candidatus Daviesbacteria bacterium]|nr:dTDP-glucose 4,6-dehydratase [Candidatus Daviesbacteria bacterium]